MISETVNIGDLRGNEYAFHNASALLNQNRKKEFGTVIAESSKKLIVVDDEIIREHVYLIPKTKVDHYGYNQVYFNTTENSLKVFELYR
jgi:hypothetical protein